MRRKIVTPSGQADLENIAHFINRDNPAAALRYLEVAEATFLNLPDMHTPVRTSKHLPEHVRTLHVPRFSGYTLHIAIFEAETYLIAAFRPGLPEHIKVQLTQRGLRET